jgi:hypothetical protein
MSIYFTGALSKWATGIGILTLFASGAHLQFNPKCEWLYFVLFMVGYIGYILVLFLIFVLWDSCPATGVERQGTDGIILGGCARGRGGGEVG